MALETGTYISDLVATNPTGSDALAFADDHLRLVKQTIKNTFPNISGAVTKTHTQINNTVDKTGDTMTGALVLPGNPTAGLQATPKQYVDGVLATAIGTKADKATTVSAGTGLTGGGDLSANRSLAIASTGVTAGSYGSATAIPVISVNAQGQVTSASTTPVVGIVTGVGAITTSGGTFNATLGPTGRCLIQVQGIVRATYGNWGDGSMSISIGGTTVASKTTLIAEADGRNSESSPVIYYKHTGTPNSTVTITFTYSGPGSFYEAGYSFIGH